MSATLFWETVTSGGRSLRGPVLHRCLRESDAGEKGALPATCSGTVGRMRTYCLMAST
jgi:hypothetical protein